jgi:hypothetical protein
VHEKKMLEKKVGTYSNGSTRSVVSFGTVPTSARTGYEKKTSCRHEKYSYPACHDVTYYAHEQACREVDYDCSYYAHKKIPKYCDKQYCGEYKYGSANGHMY